MRFYIKFYIKFQIRYGKLEEPQNPLLRYIPDPESELHMMLDGYEELEKSIGYKFRDSSYLLQAFTHASYQPNRLTDCYQRLEFLGDAVLGELLLVKLSMKLSYLRNVST